MVVVARMARRFSVVVVFRMKKLDQVAVETRSFVEASSGRVFSFRIRAVDSQLF